MKSTKTSRSSSDLPFNGHQNGRHDGNTTQFGCSAQELSELLELDRQEAAGRIQESGGVEEMCKRLETSPTQGLSGSVSDLQIRAQTFGSNASTSLRASQNFLPLLWNATWDITLGILIVTAVIAFSLSFVPKEVTPDSDPGANNSTSDWIEFVALFLIIFLIVLAIAIVESYKQQWICFAGAKKIHRCMVIRGGEYLEIPAEEIVVGDICDVSYGNIVPASGLLIHGNGVRVKENIPAGTVKIVAKDHRKDPVIHSGCHVVGGSGSIVVTKVGPHPELFKKLCVSFNQKIQKVDTKVQASGPLCNDPPKQKLSMLDEDHSDVVFHLKRKSMLESKIRLLSIRLCYAGIAGTVLLVGALIVQLFLKTFVSGKPVLVVHFVHDFMRCLLLTAAVVVVIIPVRLPAGVVLVFAQTLKRMMLQGNLVHHIGALENIGYVTDVITNKTGTMTKNQMSVAQLHLGGRLYKGSSEYHRMPSGVRSLLINLLSLGTEYTADVEPTERKSDARILHSDKRDCALLQLVLDLGQSYKAARRQTPSNKFLSVHPFNSSTKFSIKVIPCEQGGYQLITKGAAELILNRCNWILDGSDDVQPLTNNDLENVVQNILRPMSAAGLSTICLAVKNYVPEVPKANEECSSPEPNWGDVQNIMSNLTCVAIFGIEDPLRDELPESVRACQKFGVKVHLVTGEAVDAAGLLAVNCGIVEDHDKSEILEGKTFEAQIRRIPTGPIVPQYFTSVWPKIRVIARASPENRFTVVRTVSEYISRLQCQVIACTGKDLADVPSLKKADVGFSMRTVGSDVTREASDIILQNDSFSGIVNCIVWSRCIQENVRRLIQFQLTAIAVTFFIVMIGVCVFKESLLQPTHLLWIKIIVDSLAAVALTSERPMEKDVDRQPYKKLESLFSRSVGKTVILHSLYQITVVLVLLFGGQYFMNMEEDHGHKNYKTSQKFTIVFNSFILMILFNEISSRMLNGERNIFYRIYCNYAFVGTWIGSFIAQVFIIRYGGTVLSTVSLTLEQWGWCLFFGIGELLWCQIIAFLPNFGSWEKPKSWKNDVRKMEQNTKVPWEIEYDDQFDDSHLGMILWKHGLTRLQNQLRVARAFRNILEDSSDFQSSPGSLSDSDLDGIRHRLPKHLQSFSTHNCFYPQLHPRERPESVHQTLNLKSKSADDVLFEPWNRSPTGEASNQAALPGSSKAGNVPCRMAPS